jgi:hypothetical protein
MTRHATRLAAFALLATACRPTRTVTLAWDRPAVAPDNYQVFVDLRRVLEIPPPPVDPRCHCLTVAVQIPRGEHVLRVEACNRSGVCTPSARLIVR